MAWVWEFNPEVPLQNPIKEQIEGEIQRNWYTGPPLMAPFTVECDGWRYGLEVHKTPRSFVLRCVAGPSEVLHHAIAIATWREA